MQKIFTLLLLLCGVPGWAGETELPTGLVPGSLECEYRTNPVGIGTERPRFSWKLIDPAHTRGQKQTAWQALVASDSLQLARGEGDVWDSGKIVSAQSFLVPFGGKELVSGREYFWKVKVFDKDGRPSEWSETASFVTGLLHEADWQSSWWIKHPDAPEKKHIWFRKQIHLPAAVRSSFIHVASAGYHELYVNGRKADDRILAPAASRISTRVLYVTYDITHLLEAGDNVIALWQGTGWASFPFFNLPSCLRVRLDGETVDGERFRVVSDTDWRCAISNSENIQASNYAGERIDARAHIPDWNGKGFDDSRWAKPKRMDFRTQLCAHTTEPTKIIDTLTARTITGDGPYRIDLGRNFTGWIGLRMIGLKAGDLVRIQVSNDEGHTATFDQEDQFIAAGAESEYYCNRFNYIAGRYITVEGLRQRPAPEDIAGYAIASDLVRSGHFTSSNELFNRIYETDLWTFRANTTEGFTADCPHRERQGYGEVAFATAWGIGLPGYRSGAFYHHVVRNWTDVQEADGWIHHTAPQINRDYGGPMWSSAGLNVGWEHYLHFGDKEILALAYPSAKRWLAFLDAHTQDGLLRPYKPHWGHFLGDWAAPGQRKEPGDSPQALFFNNCVFVMNLETAAQMAEQLGFSDEAAAYRERSATLKERIQEVFFHPATGAYADGIQVHQAFPLLAGITPEGLRAVVAEYFRKELEETHPYLDMGSSGLPVLLKFLTDHPEYGKTVARHLSQTTEPGYGYFLQSGETAWPEYWNVDVPSRIHTCYTGIAAWFVKGLCGIQSDASHPGYRSFAVRPVIVPEATFAEASVESPYGLILCRWERKKRSLRLSVDVPPGTEATVYIPTRRADRITESGSLLDRAAGIIRQDSEGDYAVVRAEAGHYTFDSPYF
ncbi:MAG: glycoside hydrolase family 78 protein [Tannerellaceae bacterium]|jgi:alpha-L-rhamnosidase|nr:glycoside hydrolase family 78 protein [Tannerellaceae bacterium]